MADGLMIRNQESGIRNQRVGVAAPRLLISVLCLLMPVLCYAEELPDPTRPPTVSAASGAAFGQGGESRRSSGLQTIIISESRRAAIIDGKTVELWEKHGNAQLIEVNQVSVVLQGAQSRKVLTLFPDVKISRKESPNPESPVEQPSSASDAQTVESYDVQSGESSTEPTAHEEKK